MSATMSFRPASRPVRRSRRPAPSALALAALASLCALPAAAAEDVSALLRQKTQAFSEAGQWGDTTVMDRLLDANVIFFNENGDGATKADLVSGGPPPAKDVHVTMMVTDWSCQVHGDVAVAGFIDDQVVDFHGQRIHAKFRSVETWLKEGADWRLIGSETIALQDDPVPVKLPPSTLDEYVGSYQAAPGVAVTFSRGGEGLMASTNGGPPTAQMAELRDVFFTPGLSRVRKIFQRDASGKVTGFVSRHEGHDVVFTRL